MIDPANPDEVRDYCEKGIARERLYLEDREKPPYARSLFTTTSPNFIIAHLEKVLRWMDCAPKGATFYLAPLQDKDGIPCGMNTTAGTPSVMTNKLVRNV
jgi:hypothetical protein